MLQGTPPKKILGLFILLKFGLAYANRTPEESEYPDIKKRVVGETMEKNREKD